MIDNSNSKYSQPIVLPYSNNHKKAYKTYEVFFGLLLVAGVVLLIIGAIFWAEGNWQLSVQCDAAKTINEALGVYTTNEIDAIYASCQAQAQALIRWSKPVCIGGAAVFVVMFVLILPILVMGTMNNNNNNNNTNDAPITAYNNYNYNSTEKDDPHTNETELPKHDH